MSGVTANTHSIGSVRPVHSFVINVSSPSLSSSRPFDGSVNGAPNTCSAHDTLALIPTDFIPPGRLNVRSSGICAPASAFASS